MQPKTLNEWQSLLAVLVAWTGGFMGAVQGQSAFLEKWGNSYTTYNAWQVGGGTIHGVTMCVCGMVAE
jgi:hypothetical protein